MAPDSLTAEDSQESEDRRVCPECIGEPFLRHAVETQGVNGTCSYCTGDGKTLSIRQLADRVKTVLEEFFYQTKGPSGGSKLVVEIVGDIAMITQPSQLR